jgi:hypothetical protein
LEGRGATTGNEARLAGKKKTKERREAASEERRCKEEAREAADQEGEDEAKVTHCRNPCFCDSAS